MAIYDDFTAYMYEDQFRVRHESGTTVYTMNALYSWRKDDEEELWNLSFYDTMTAQTDFDYTMVNGAFFDDNSVKYTKTGTLVTSGYADAIRVLQFGATYTNAVSGDIGLQALGSVTADTGTLLHYDNTAKKWWVRMDDTGDLFDDDDETVEVTTAGGTGTGTVRTVSITGEDKWNNCYTLGVQASSPAPLVYIVRNREEITNDADGSAWWARGQIDVLVKVQEGGVEIDGANLEFYARQANDIFGHYNVDMSGAGGQTPIILNTSTDLNATKPEYYILADNRSNGGVSVGDVMVGGTSSATAEVISVQDLTGNNDLIGMGNVIGTFGDGEDINVSGSDKGDINGTAGDSWLEFDNESGVDYVVTSVVTGQSTGATGTIRGVFYDLAAAGFLVLESSGAGAWIDYDDDEQITDGTTTADVDGDSTRAVAGFDDININFINGTLAYNSQTQNFTLGDTLVGGTSGATGIIMKDVDAGATGTLTLANVTGVFENGEALTDDHSGDGNVNSTHGLVATHTMDYAFTQQSEYPYDVFVECAGRPIADAYMFCQFRCRSGQDQTLYSYESKERRLKFTAAHGCIESDIGKSVLGGSTNDTGILLSYTSDVMIIEPDDHTTDLFDEAETVSVQSGTGTGTTEGCSNINPMEGWRYQIAYSAYAEKQTAPFGNMAGVKLFGAQGVMYRDVAAADAQNFEVIDSNTVPRYPPDYQAIEATGCVTTEFLSIWRGDGSGNIDKTLYQSHNTNNAQGDSDVEVLTAISTDTPDSGVLHIRDNTNQWEHRIRYDSWDTSTFTFPTKITSQTTSGGGKDTINNTGGSFLSADIEYGDIVRNVTDGSWAQVVEVVSDTEITTTYLVGGTEDDWDSGDTYEFHTLPETIANTDYVFPAYINKVVTAGTENISLIYPGTERQVILVYRDKTLQVYRQAGTWDADGVSIPVVRNPDTIVS
jgi:hypothetical protein